MQNSFTIKEAISYGWKKTTENLAFFGLLTLAFIVVASVLDKMGHGPASIGIARLINIFVGYFGMFTFVRLGLKTWRGEKVALKDVFEIDWNLFLLYVVGAILFTISYVVGFVLFIIPGLIVIIRFGFFAFILLEEKIKPVDALKKSFKMTNGYFWKLLGFSVVLLIISIIGAIPFGLGLIITAPLCLLATVYVYEKIKSAPAPVEVVSVA